MKRLLCLLALVLLVASGAREPEDVLTVTRKTTKLRAEKRLFAPAVADLREGDKLVLQKKEGAWLAVELAPAKDVAPKEVAKVRGWLHETEVSAKPDVRLSGEGVRETYTASETTAARKGFNPEVERSHRGKNPRLELAFRLVDRLQARAVSDDDLRAFLVAGGLLEEGR